MSVTTVVKGESRTKARAIPLVIVAAVLRILDVAMILVTAQIIRPAFNEHEGVDPYYGMAAVLAALLAVIIFHVNGLYRLKGLSFRHLREQLTQMSVGWGIAFVILILLILPRSDPETSRCAFPS